MTISSWLRRHTRGRGRGGRVLYHGSSRGKSTPRRSRSLRLELLEHRTVLSALAVSNLFDSGAKDNDDDDDDEDSALAVSNLFDSGAGSLRAAIAAANTNPGPDLIEFNAGLKGTITLASELSITDDLTIDGTSAKLLTVSGGGATRVFHVTGASTDVAIDGLTIANGQASVPAGIAFGGGVLNEGASVSLSRVVVANNHAVGHAAAGGAIANLGGSFTANHTDFLGNISQSNDGQIAWGGAVYNDQGAIADIENARFSGNVALGGNANGGAVGAVGGSQVTLAHCSFDANQAQGNADDGAFGGAVQAQSSGFLASSAPTVTIAYCSFTGNQAVVRDAANGADANSQGNGGALDIEEGAIATVSHSRFHANRARGANGGDGSAGSAGGFGGASFGGAIMVNSGNLAVSYSLFTGNETRGGSGGNGGAGGDGGFGNFALGGAIAATAIIADTVVLPSVQIDHCVFLGNRAIGGDGGAGGAGGNGGFASRGDGGGVINLFGTMTVSHSLIVGSAARGGAGGAAGSGAGTVGGDGGLARGGGFANERGGAATLTHTTIVNNRATGGAGGAGAAGGDALGGGVFNGRPMGAGTNPGQAAILSIADSTISANVARGGAGGVGGNGGNGFGGGIFNGNPVPVAGTPTVTLSRTKVTANQAVAGAAGLGGAGGLGQGGGLYNQIDAVANVDALTKIRANLASTSDDDIFGTVTPF